MESSQSFLTKTSENHTLACFSFFFIQYTLLETQQNKNSKEIRE